MVESEHYWLRVNPLLRRVLVDSYPLLMKIDCKEIDIFRGMMTLNTERCSDKIFSERAIASFGRQG